MNETESVSLQYLMARTRSPEWLDFLRVLADELNEQMSAEELRAFFYVLGRRLADDAPIGEVESLEELEQAANAFMQQQGWGWVSIRDVHTSLELVHSCSPLRAAFGDAAMDWSPALLEGVYSVWMRQMGAGDELELRQIGDAEGARDTLRFRLAHPSMFS